MRDLSGDPIETLREPMFQAARCHQLHADTNAKKWAAFATHHLLQRVTQSGHSFEPTLAIGVGADTRQHHPVRSRHDVGI